jgi:hypothetical protein
LALLRHSDLRLSLSCTGINKIIKVKMEKVDPKQLYSW